MNEEQIFAAAIQLPVADRAAFLRVSCADNVALRRRVERLLVAHDSKDSLLEVAAPMESTTDSVAAGRHPVIGNYKLLHKLGEGGFGVVYMAEQLRPVRRKVALKIVKAERMGDATATVARFEAERQALAMMDHPNIATVFDGGAIPAGSSVLDEALGSVERPFFVMELVNGVPITEYCDKNNLSTRERLKLFASVCLAVQHAHQKGVIHRDLKPSNILVTLHDGVPVVKIIDFGVAKAINQQLTDKTLYTVLGDMIGTPLYMSPEQAERSGLDIDTRSDIYSLGVLLYELLTGTTPLSAKDLKEAGVLQIQRRIVESEPPKPSTRLSNSGDALTVIAKHRSVSADRLHRELQGDLDWIVMKALEKDRQRRYDTAKGFAVDVDRYLNNEAIFARPPSTLYLLSKFTRKYRGAVVGGAIVLSSLLMVLAGLLVATLTISNAKKREETNRKKAVHEQQIAEQERDRAEELSKQYSEQRYFADMNVASQAWDQNDVLQLRAMLKRYEPQNFQRDLRDFAWHWLNRLSQEVDIHSRVFEMPYGVQHVVFDRAGRTVAVALQDNTVEIFRNSDSGELTRIEQFGVRYERMWSYPRIALTPDGLYLVRPADDFKALERIDLTNGHVETFARSDNKFKNMTISPDGRHIVVVFESSVAVWNIHDMSPTDVWEGPTDFGRAIAFSSNGEMVAWEPSPGVLKLAKRGTKQEPLIRSGFDLAVDRGNSARISICVFSKDDQRLLVGMADGLVRVLKTDDLSDVSYFVAHQDAIRDMAFSPDGTMAATSGRDNAIRIWRWPECRPLGTLRGHGGSVNSIGFHPNGEQLVSGSLDGTIRYWSISSFAESTDYTLDEKFLYLGACENSREFYVGTDKSLVLLNIHEGPHRRLVNHEVRGIIVSPGGRYVQSDQFGKVQVGRLDQLEPDKEFQIDAERIPLATSSNMQYILFGNGRQSPQLWSLADAKELCELQVRPLNVHYTDNRGACAFSADDSLVAVPTADYGIAVFSVPEGKQMRVLRGHKQGVVSLAFSPTDKNMLATCSWDNTVRLWDLSSGMELATMRHSQWIAAVTFSPDGTRLASVAGDQKLKVWHVPSGQQILTADTGFSHPRSVRFSSDGMSIAVAQAFDPDKYNEYGGYRVFRGDPVR